MFMQVLLTKRLRELFRAKYPLHSQDGAGDDAKVIAKFFFPIGRYTFFVTEGSPRGEDFVFFGYCLSPLGSEFDEWGYAALSELAETRFGIFRIERDMSLEPARYTLGELYQRPSPLPGVGST